MGLFERHGPSDQAVENVWMRRDLAVAERKIERLRQIIVEEIERCDPDEVDRAGWPAGFLNFRRQGWLDGVKITRTVVRERMRRALDDLADLD